MKISTIRLLSWVFIVATSACASNADSIARVEESSNYDTSDASVTRFVGTVGARDFDGKKNYEFLMRPKLSRSGEVVIPASMDEAVLSLKSALPEQLLAHLKPISGVCTTEDANQDALIRSWMIHYWRLRSANDLTKAFGTSGHMNAQYVAEETLRQLCATLP